MGIRSDIQMNYGILAFCICVSLLTIRVRLSSLLILNPQIIAREDLYSWIGILRRIFCIP